jgi:hypothetical protein
VCKNPYDDPADPDESGVDESGVDETSWVRTIYLYAMCAIAVALVAFGSIMAVMGLVRAIAPDLGHRDTLDRVGIGVSNIATDVIDLAFENLQDIDSIERFCDDVTDNEADFDDCVDQETGASQIDAIQQGISEVSDELRSQIRSNSIDTMIRGVLLLAAGVVLWLLHGPRTSLYGNGLMPARRKESREPPTSEDQAADPPDERFPPPPSS